MAKGFKHGAGGVGLNFKVICNPQPSTAKENTIWVDTDRINNYYFSATQPENMEEYDVWFLIGTASTVEFNALKNNCIQVYPLSAKQYVSGEWVDKTAKSYTGGKWVDWVTPEYIFKDGEFYFGEMSTSTSGRLYVDGGELVFVTAQEKGTWGYLTEQVDLTHYKKLKAKMKQTTVVNNMCIVLSVTTTSPPTAGDSSKVKSRSKAYLEITATDGEIHELETSVETLGGLHYIEFASIASGAIVEAWFE